MQNTTSVPNFTRPVNGTESVQRTADAVSNGLWVARVSVLVACMVIAFPKNLQVIFILYKHKHLRKVPHVLLGSLSIVSAIASGYYLPLYLFISLVAQNFFERIPTWLCVLRYSSNVFIVGLQAFSLVSMAIDRQDCVVRPFKRRIRRNKVWKLVKGIWLVAALLAFVHLFLSLGEAKGNCYGQQKTRTRSQTYTLVVGTIITIFVTFLRIVKKLRLSPFGGNNQNTESHVTRFTYVVLFGFILAWFPLTFFVPLNLAVRFKSPYVGEIKALFLAITNLTYAVNPFAHMRIIKVALRARAGPAKARGEPAKERPKPAQTEQQADKVEGNLDAELERGKDPSTVGRGQVRGRAELDTARSESPAKSRPGTAGAEEQVDKVEGNSDGAELKRGKNPSTVGRGQVRERAELSTARSESPAKSRPGSAGAEEQADEVEGNSDTKL